MNTLTTKRRHSDRGASLAEILITVFLIGVVGTLIAGTVIAAMKTTRSTQSGVEGQSQLNDALSRIARDVASADPLLATTTSWGTGVGASPSATELWTQAVIQYKCVRTRYWLDTTGSTKALKSATQVFPGETCPDPTTAVSTPAPNVKTIIKDFKDTTTSGATVPVFTYYNKANAVIPTPIARADIAKIARVKIDVGSNVRERGQGVRLSTSATPRSLDGSLVTGVPAPVCNTYTSTDSTATVIGADLTGGHDTAYVTSPTLTWKTADYGDTYVLRRQNTDNTGNAIPGSWTTVGTYTSGQNITDTAMRGRYGRDLNYELDVTGPGGTVTCGVSIGRIANKPPAAPMITVTLEPDTSAGPHTSDFTVSTARVTFPAVAEVEQYSLWKRPIELNNAPFSATAPANWQYHALINAPANSFAPTMFFDTGYEWMVVATDRDWIGPDGTVGVNSPYSNTGKTLAHNNATIIANVVTSNPNRDAVASNQTGPVTHNQNRVSWWNTTDNTADGFRVWKRPTGTTTWSPASGLLPTSQTSFLDTGVPLGTRYDYTVTTYNQGPRGTSYTGTGSGDIYYGRYSNVVSILQYPADPVYYARGTENANAYNPDGRNSVHWPAVASATNYKIDEYNTRAQVTGFTFFSANTAATDWYSTDRTARGSRQFYVVSAQNATGWSPNTADNSLRSANVAIAYQRPPTPPMTWAASPNLNEDASVGNATVFNYTRNGDTGESSEDKFCASESQCWYYAYRDSALQETEIANNGDDGVIGAMGRTEWWGSSATWGVFACNPGGCSDGNYVGVNYYPGPFAPKLAVFGDYRTLDQWGKGGGYSRTWTGDGGANYNWTRSYGATWWAINRTPVADDPFNYGGSQWYNQSGAYNNMAPGWSRTDTTNQTGGNQQLQDAYGNPMRPWGTPGSVQRFSISSVAANGLSRFNFIDYQQKAAPVRFMETARACTTANTTRWRVAGRIFAQAALYDAVTGTARNTHTGHFRVTSFAARRSGNLGGALTQGAADYEYISVSDGQLKSNGGVFDDGQWMMDGWQDTFWYHQGIGNGAYGTAIGAGGMFSAADASWNMPKDSGVGAALRATGFTTFADAHAVADGDWGGVSVSLNEFTADGVFTCPSSSWAADIATISRSGVMGGGSTLDPTVGAGRSWSLPGN